MYYGLNTVGDRFRPTVEDCASKGLVKGGVKQQYLLYESDRYQTVANIRGPSTEVLFLLELFLIILFLL